MSPEQMRDCQIGYTSDVASLGYVLIEMLTGSLLFKDCQSIESIYQAKISLPDRLERLLPAEVKRDASLASFVHKMVAVDPSERFPDAEAADLDRHGAVSFHRKLIKEDLSTEYDRELAWWIEALH